MEHTELPWIVAAAPVHNHSIIRIESKDKHGVDNDGWVIAEFLGPDALSNADFVALACGCHKDLLAVCEACIGIIGIEDIVATKAKAKAALKKVNGE